MTPEPSEKQWAAWFDLQKIATHVWLEGDLPRAIAMLDEFVGTHPPKPVERQAIGFRGSLYEEAGDLEAAKADFLTAVALSEEADFERYTLEESLAAASERLGDDAEAERWCLSALRTAAEDPKTSGAGSLLRLVRLRDEQPLTSEERHMVKKVVYQGWSLLRVEGKPDLEDLTATAKKLLRAQRGPFSPERPPMPQAYQDPAES